MFAWGLEFAVGRLSMWFGHGLRKQKGLDWRKYWKWSYWRSWYGVTKGLDDRSYWIKIYRGWSCGGWTPKTWCNSDMGCHGNLELLKNGVKTLVWAANQIIRCLLTCKSLVHLPQFLYFCYLKHFERFPHYITTSSSGILLKRVKSLEPLCCLSYSVKNVLFC